MATVTITLAGDTDKYAAELWYADMTTKIGDVPLNTPYVATGGANFGVADVIIFRPLSEDYNFDSYTTDLVKAQDWNAALEITELNPNGDPWGAGLRGMYLLNTLVVNVSNSPTFELAYLGSTVTVTPFNRIHLMDSDALTDFSELRLVETDVDGNEVFNYSVYIINLLNIGFELGESYFAGDSEIILGDKETGITTPLLIGDSVVVSLGNIVVPASTSSLDFLSNTFELILPFIEAPIDLVPSLVVGKTVSVEYVLDVYTGDLTVNVYNGETEPFLSSKVSIGRNIPTKVQGETNYTISGTNGVINNVLAAYIRHTKPELITGQYSNLITKTGVIGAYTGYLEVENMDLISNALSNEKAQILSLLSSGVIIK